MYFVIYFKFIYLLNNQYVFIIIFSFLIFFLMKIRKLILPTMNNNNYIIKILSTIVVKTFVLKEN